jgi:hypothetical protein
MDLTVGHVLVALVAFSKLMAEQVASLRNWGTGGLDRRRLQCWIGSRESPVDSFL